MDFKRRILISRRRFLFPFALAPLWRRTIFPAARIVRSDNPQIQEFDFASLKTLITPNQDFFIRNHFSAPSLASHVWRIRVTGHVRSPLEITSADIQRAPARGIVATLECAGNPVGGGGVSTAEWTGITLESLLKRAGLRPGAREIRFVGADHGNEGSSSARMSFVRSIPVEKALHPDTLLAYRMNGAPLPPEHGHPVRAIVAGWYAMDCVKWLTRIEALAQPDTSFFMTHEYVALRLQTLGSERSPVTRMQVKSQIAWPRQGEVLVPGSYTIRGAAWAGENRVARVDVSTNGGRDWRAATLETAASRYSWVLWNYQWEVREAGEYRMLVNATDEKGNSQPSSRDPLRVDAYELNWRQSLTCVVR